MPVKDPARSLKSTLGLSRYTPMVPRGPNLEMDVVPQPQPNDRYNHYCIVDNLSHYFSIEWGSKCRKHFGRNHMVADQP